LRCWHYPFRNFNCESHSTSIGHGLICTFSRTMTAAETKTCYRAFTLLLIQSFLQRWDGDTIKLCKFTK